MSMSDPVADMLTRIRNGVMARFASVEMPLSGLKAAVAGTLKREGFIEDYQVDDQCLPGTLRIVLKYGPNRERVVNGLRRVSKPGARRYTPSDAIPKVMSGLGIAILSTSRGVLTDREARAQNVGGEILCEVW